MNIFCKILFYFIFIFLFLNIGYVSGCFRSKKSNLCNCLKNVKELIHLPETDSNFLYLENSKIEMFKDCGKDEIEIGSYNVFRNGQLLSPEDGRLISQSALFYKIKKNIALKCLEDINFNITEPFLKGLFCCVGKDSIMQIPFTRGNSNFLGKNIYLECMKKQNDINNKINCP